MATIDYKNIIDGIVAGEYAEDRSRLIVQYTNAFGNQT